MAPRLRLRIRLACLAFLACGLTTPARANLVLTIGNVSLNPGGTGTVGVFLQSTATAQDPDLINNYAFQLQIRNNGTDNTQLAFAGVQDPGYLATPTYVFSGDSYDAETNSTPAGPPGKTIYPNDTITGLDSTFSGNPEGLSAGTTYLLATLTLTTVTGAPPKAGDSFTIALTPASGSGSIINNANTYFDYFDFGAGSEVSATPFKSNSSNSGQASIIAAATVPEPPSLALGLVGFCILTAARGSIGGPRPRKG